LSLKLYNQITENFMKKGRKESNRFLAFCVFVDLNSNFKGSSGYRLFAMEVFVNLNRQFSESCFTFSRLSYF